MGKTTHRKDPEVNDQESGGQWSIVGGMAQSDTLEGPPLADILQAITSSREALETKIDTLATAMGLLQDDHHWLAERVTTTERELAGIPLELVNMKGI